MFTVCLFFSRLKMNNCFCLLMFSVFLQTAFCEWTEKQFEMFERELTQLADQFFPFEVHSDDREEQQQQKEQQQQQTQAKLQQQQQPQQPQLQIQQNQEQLQQKRAKLQQQIHQQQQQPLQSQLLQQQNQQLGMKKYRVFCIFVVLHTMEKHISKSSGEYWQKYIFKIVLYLEKVNYF
jgi:hypothetical protein